MESLLKLRKMKRKEPMVTRYQVQEHGFLNPIVPLLSQSQSDSGHFISCIKQVLSIGLYFLQSAGSCPRLNSSSKKVHLIQIRNRYIQDGFL
jgi:hypothetical protein